MDNKFKHELAVLCSEHVAKALYDESFDGFASIIEAMASSLAMTIGISSRGNAKLMNELAEGSSAYIFESLENFAKLGDVVGRMVSEEDGSPPEVNLDQ